MAYMVPEVISRQATTGERILFHTLKEYLPSDYIVYYEPEINGRRPDFVIIGPDLGLVVLEVKDYTRSTLYELNHDEWTLHTSSGNVVVVKNPLKQARDNARHIVGQLKKDKNLIQLEGQYHGHLKFAYGFGTVFSRLKQADFIKNDLYQIIPPEFVLCRDEIDPDDPDFDPGILLEKIHNMFTNWSRRRYILTNEDIQAIRYHLFPEVRISADMKQTGYYQDQLLLSLHNIKTMDLHQENLARQLGDKHRLIRGVAGSGKTLVLASRAKILAKTYPEWKILVLCYGIPLSRNLKQLIHKMMQEPEDLFDFIQEPNSENKDNGDRIEVYNFHEWLRRVLKTREEDIPRLIDKIENKEAILPTYDAILVDEGQDFETDWLRLLGHVINPSTQSLLLVEDRAQSIFKRKNSLAQDTGLDFRGRSKILTINYRNTAEIVQFAWDFYQTHSQLKNKVKMGTTEGVEIIPPQSTRRRGPEPVIKKLDGIRAELAFISQQIQELHHEYSVPYADMTILYRVKNSYHISYIDEITSHLKAQSIPYTWVTESAESKRNFSKNQESVKISTIDSAKGLDFRAVFIVNAESMPFPLEEDEEREVSLMYIAMTRALEWLYVTFSGESKYTKYLMEYVEAKRTEERGRKEG